MPRVLVDIDGTLLDGRSDEAFTSKMEAEGLDAAREWYKTNCPDDLEVNYCLLAELMVYKALGYTMVLWTNRSFEQIQPTLRNLGRYHLERFFDFFIFGNGNKCQYLDNDDCIVFDNEWKNLAEVKLAKFIPTFK